MQALPQLLWLRCLKSIIDFSPLTVAPETSVLNAISLMTKQSTQILVVTSSQIVGCLTQQDILHLLASGVDFKTTKVSEVMHTSVITLKLSEFKNMATALSLLNQNNLVFLPIVDSQGQLVGTITSQSICRELSQPTSDYDLLVNHQKAKLDHEAVLETTGIPVFDVEAKFQNITACKQAESALRETQQQLQAILDNSSAVIYVIDTKNQFLLINRKFEQLFKITQDQIIGKSIYDIWSADIADGFAANNHQVVAGNISIEAEEVVPHEDGLHTYLSVKSPLKNADGLPYAVCSISTDITDRKIAEESLLRFCQAIESTSDAICMADITGKPIYVNSGFTELYEYTLKEFQAVGGALTIFQHPAQLQQVLMTIYKGEPWRGEVTMRSRSSHIMQIYLRAYVIKDTNGKIIGTVATHTDVTQRRQAEIALLVSQQRLQYLLDSSPAVIYTAKASGDFGGTFVSENVSTILGYEAKEMIEDSSFWASRIHPEDLPDVFTELSKVLEQEQYKLEYRFLHQDGSYRWLYDKGKLLRDDTGNPLELVGYLAEITDRKQLEQELRVALEKEKELSELKSRFVSMTSHEFRTPLSTILSSAELLEHYHQKWTEEKKLTHLRRIQTAVKRMTDMLNDVLVIGKVEAGNLEFKPKSFDLVAYCHELVAEMQLNFNYQRVINFISQDESASCCMDNKLLGHILSNLLSNAIKYSPANSAVKFTLACENGQAIFEIQDWGIGIPPEDLPHLFESFYRAQNVGNILGTGLGLAIVKRCVDIHQGEIFVTSKLEVGTLFTVTLPFNNRNIS
ncbi:PAS domain S-box protein [Halotia branconii]|uniref:histidine kinase n=1 Tax=Halotia branconii CENA392 TaxID=1539056 RepID=A0AAJ6NSS6_9CYAN|nr:PAS domain S-box protein [Halotia branconii]WGV26050.1 PAS domain S-box protein [Halotia branconii CENA392]